MQSLYEHKLITYPRTDSRYLTEDMAETVTAVIHLSANHPPFSNRINFMPDTYYLFDNSKVSDHHAIIPTMQIENISMSELPNGERDILQLIICKLLCAAAEPYIYESVTADFECAGNTFTAKGKSVIQEGWKAVENIFHSADDNKTRSELNILNDISEGQEINVTADIKEGVTSPPKAYTEDTLLSAMETAGASETIDASALLLRKSRSDDRPPILAVPAKRKGLGTPATRASIIEKLVQTGFAERKGRNIIPTKDGISLASILPDTLSSPLLTAEWENKLTEIANGGYSDTEFMTGIETLIRELIDTYSFISEENKNIFNTPREIIGICPRCGANVHESKANFCCANKDCGFVMWKNDRFFTSKHKELTKKIAVDLLKSGKSNVKGLYSEKTGNTYDAAVVLNDTGGKYVNYKLEFPKRDKS